ncbi:MAG: penicillin acylase family protein [Beijerinckiaceae bacterium]
MAFTGSQDETLAVTGLKDPASIVIDRYGISHLRAGSEHDLWFMQGFNAARDRLWQIDLWRKRGLGLLAENFGPGFLEQDKASRLFLYRGDMAAEWQAYAPDAKDICTRFAEGVNAFIALTQKEPERLPPEFAITATQPQHWSAEDVVRIRTHGLSRQAVSKVMRARVLAKADLKADALRKVITPDVAPTHDPAVDLSAVPESLIHVMRLATLAPTFSPERMAATMETAHLWRKVTDLGDMIMDAQAQGSNNWAVHGSRTATGKPILGSDPHRAHGLPSLRYLVHLSAPGFDAIGAGEPSVPGLSFGHNDTAAFCMTIFGMDHEDVYVYAVDPANANRYRYRDDWEDMTIVHDIFAVRGADDQKIDLLFTRHGPVIGRSDCGQYAYAVRSVWFEPGGAPYLASLSTMRAKTFDQFRAGNARWVAPSANNVYADVNGTIAWVPGGLIPRRMGWNGLLPVPGDGRYEWQGFLPASEYPERVNPAKGFVATANEFNLPDDWDHEKKSVGFEWLDASRISRLNEVLSSQPQHTVADSQSLQTDTVSTPARRLIALLQKIATGSDAAQKARAMLVNWDARMDSDSGAAALFEIWWTLHLKPALFHALAPEVAAMLVPGDADGVLDALENPDARFGADAAAARDGVMMASLADAYATATQRLGRDEQQWAWGKIHHGYFEHPLAAVQSGKTSAPDIGPFPKGGSALTPMYASYRGSDFRVLHGASFRMVVDCAEFDRSVCMNAPGQSGDPRSRHYDALAPLWARGDYVPMLYSRAAVDAAAETVLTLTPA